LKIVESLIAKFIEKVLKDMEKIADSLEQDDGLNPIEKVKQDMRNKEAYKKMYSKQALLIILKIF